MKKRERRNAPEIRFEGFDEDWEQRKLGDISKNFEYGLNASATEYDGENKYIRITDIDDNSHKFLIDKVTSPDTDLSLAANYLLEEGDILFARTGASVGKTYIYDVQDGKVYYAGYLIRAKVKSEYDSQFIFLNTLTSKYYNFVKITSQRSGQPGINAKEYASFSILMPEKAEQVKIGNFFKQLDKTIALHLEKLQKLKRMKRGFLQVMFPQKEETEPQLRFANFVSKWEQRKLGDMGSVAMCKRIFKDQTSEDGEIPFFKIGTFGGIPDSFISRELFDEYRSRYPFPENGDVLISASGTIGRTMIYNGEKAYYQDSNIVWLKRDKKQVDNSFLQQFYQVVKWAGVEGSTIKRLYNNNILSTAISLPSIDEQEKIGVFYKKLDDTIALHQTKLEKLQSLKKAYLQKMFI